jgi:hypothetical protein
LSETGKKKAKRFEKKKYENGDASAGARTKTVILKNMGTFNAFTTMGG